MWNGLYYLNEALKVFNEKKRKCRICEREFEIYGNQDTGICDDCVED